MNKFPLDQAEFWNLDTLAILFQATQNTQRPFLSRLIDGRARYVASQNALTNYAKNTFRLAITAAKPRAESLDLLRSLASRFGSEALADALKGVSWHSGVGKFFRPTDYAYFDPDGVSYGAHLEGPVETLDLGHLDAFDQLIARSYLQLIRDLTYGFVQFDHIQPLLKRIEASLTSLRKVLEVGYPAPAGKLVTVVSLKRCNNEVKKVVPLLLAKHYYTQHKNSVAQPPDRTLHLVIDEAHNILSQQSFREQESWKDYRLELFEEIIKEGRKFGVFLTISSQRPADISPTIVSQLHNFFIHRLVNERDLYLIDNTITTLDSLSKSMIPNLPKGCCVVTGTSFDLPLVVQVDPLLGNRRPDSEDVDLSALWTDAV